MIGIDLSSEQVRAIELCSDLTERIVGVTGGAGTGKTTILKMIHGETSPKALTALVAPTGRAAKRIQEATGIAAKTIHRLLEFPQPNEPNIDGIDFNEPRRNRSNPITERVVFVDEASMLGPTLFRQLMDALPGNGCVRFFGDNNQLAPVEQGVPPFADILERRPSVTLTYNYRSGDELVSNALRVLASRIPIRNSRFEIVYSENPAKTLIEFATEDFMSGSHQIIMPARKGKFGTLTVNTSLQLKFNGSGSFLRLPRFDDKESPLLVRGKDKFLWVKNDYNFELFNGEIGNVEWVDEESGALNLVTPDREILLPPRERTYSSYMGHMINYDPRKALELGYAITTHKAQGSEFDTVIYCISGAHAWFLDKHNAYTALTRAKNRVIMITDRRAMGACLKNKKRM